MVSLAPVARASSAAWITAWRAVSEPSVPTTIDANIATSPKSPCAILNRDRGRCTEFLEHLRHRHGAVLLLVVLHQRDDRPPHRHGRAVQRVHLLRLAAVRAVSDAQ